MLPNSRYSCAVPFAVLLVVACAPAAVLPHTAGVTALAPPVQGSTVSVPARARPLDPPLSPPVTVRVGMLSQTSDAGLFIASDKGYFREQGIEIESLPFQNAQEMVSPLGAG